LQEFILIHTFFIGSFLTEDKNPSQIQATTFSTLGTSARLSSQLRKENNKLAKTRKKFVDELGNQTVWF